MFNSVTTSSQKCYVILVNWNGAKDTIGCLRSLSLLNHPLPKIIVCDNASTDDSWIRLQAYVEECTELNVQLVQTGRNLGFAGGNNVGIRLALQDSEMAYIWLLNNDTVVTSDTLDALVGYMVEHPNVGVCGSTLRYLGAPDVIQAVGGKYNPWLGRSKHLLGHEKFDLAACRSIKVEQLDYVVGASMFIRREALKKVGLLSEEYFLYCEEIDWATRMRRRAPEFGLGYCAESIVYHREGASTGASDSVEKTYRYFSDYFFITSRLKFARKYYPMHSFIVQGSMLLVALNRIKRGQWRSAAVALWCLCGVVPGFMDPRRASAA